MVKTCATCLAGVVGERMVECRLHPPVVQPGADAFPLTEKHWWCLDWRAKERPQTETPSKGKRAWSDELKPTEKHAELAQRLKINMGEEWGKFKNYCLAHDKRYANFEAAFRNWLVSSVNMNGGKR